MTAPNETSSIYMTLADLKGKVVALEIIQARTEGSILRIEGKIDLMTAAADKTVGTNQVILWILDAGRMLVAALLGAVGGSWWVIHK